MSLIASHHFTQQRNLPMVWIQRLRHRLGVAADGAGLQPKTQQIVLQPGPQLRVGATPQSLEGLAATHPKAPALAGQGGKIRWHADRGVAVLRHAIEQDHGLMPLSLRGLDAGAGGG